MYEEYFNASSLGVASLTAAILTPTGNRRSLDLICWSDWEVAVDNKIQSAPTSDTNLKLITTKFDAEVAQRAASRSHAAFMVPTAPKGGFF